MFCGSVSTASPQLGPLQDNGGYTLMMMPGRSGSAIDTGSPGYCEASEQRGVGRPVGPGCDLGAVESTDPVYRNGFD